MFKSRLIRPQEAELHFEVMAFLIRHFGTPQRPPVPSPLHKTNGLEELAWTNSDSRSVYDWASDHFGVIKSLSDMEDFDVDIMPVEEGIGAQERTAGHRLNSFKAGRVTNYASGMTPVLYDPRDGSEPGHFAATTILQLAERRVTEFTPKTELSALEERLVTLIAAVYNRQGFVLANLPRNVSAYLTSDQARRSAPKKTIIDNLCFATCLALRVRHQSTEQIIATYGQRMTKPFRRKIRQACRQIDKRKEHLSALRILSAPETAYTHAINRKKS